MPGHPTNLVYSRAYCTCSRCGLRLFRTFFSSQKASVILVNTCKSLICFLNVNAMPGLTIPKGISFIHVLTSGDPNKHTATNLSPTGSAEKLNYSDCINRKFELF